MKISNADVAIRQADATPEDLIDVIEGNRYSIKYHTMWYSTDSLWIVYTSLVST